MKRRTLRLARRTAAHLARCIVVCFTLAAASSALAQKDPATRLLEEQRDQLRQQDLGRPQPPHALSPARPELDANPGDVAEIGLLVQDPVISVDGAGLLSPAVVEATVSPFVSLPLGERRLELLLRRLDARLVEAGYITSHAVLEDASTRTGQIRIAVRPGTVESIRKRGEPASTGLERAFPLGTGDVLRLAEVEQGIHQINRLRLYQAQVNIRSGQSPATSVLDLVLDVGKPWHASIGADNQGSRATGANRVRAGLAIDDALGMLDALQLLGLASSDSRAAFASLALPQGFNTWSLTASASQSEQRLPADLESRSTSWTALAGWNRVLLLAAEGRDSVDVSLSRSRAGRRIEGVALAANHLAVLRGAINHLRKSDWVQWYVEPALSAGLPILGAQRDRAEIERRDAHAQFVKATLAAGVVSGLASGTAELAIQVNAQSSRVSLYGQEQISLGGLSTVRGFREGVLAGDNGYLVRSELRLPRVVDLTLARGRPVPYVHLDHGSAWLAQADHQHLTGSGVGLRWAGGGATIEAVASRAIAGPDALRDGWQFHLALGFEI